MIQPPSYLISRPPMPGTEAEAAFEALFARASAEGGAEPIAYDLPWPRWQFICHIVDKHRVLVHGSQDGAIQRFEPRQSNDLHPFGDRKAVFAASDGLWSMYYAILDRTAHPMMLLNAAMRFELTDGSLGEPYYFLSISRPALQARAFKPGMLYFLPSQGFEEMAPLEVDGGRVHVAQWASFEPVTPVARIAVALEDFPLLDQIRGHDDATIIERARANPSGFPWLDDPAGNP